MPDDKYAPLNEMQKCHLGAAEDFVGRPLRYAGPIKYEGLSYTDGTEITVRLYKDNGVESELFVDKNDDESFEAITEPNGSTLTQHTVGDYGSRIRQDGQPERRDVRPALAIEPNQEHKRFDALVRACTPIS